MDALFLHEIKDLYSAEKQLVAALPKMIKAASNPHLKELIEGHLQETKGQVERLEQIFEGLGHAARATKCKAMEGLITEAAELIEEEGDSNIKDAALIAAAQRVEHYEMAAYGAARTYAEMLGYTQAVEALEQTLDEEKMADEKLNELALSEVNPAAQRG